MDAPEPLLIRHTVRFEGAPDPGDEAIVLGVECPVSGATGIIVSARRHGSSGLSGA